jgi:hypothetical protein
MMTKQVMMEGEIGWIHKKIIQRKMMEAGIKVYYTNNRFCALNEFKYIYCVCFVFFNVSKWCYNKKLNTLPHIK